MLKSNPFAEAYLRGLRDFIVAVESFTPSHPARPEFTEMMRYATSRFGITQLFLAGVLGVNVSSINGWANGKHFPQSAKPERVLSIQSHLKEVILQRLKAELAKLTVA